MRRVVITVLSLTAVLSHVQVGCCAHHEHALATGHVQPSCCAPSHPGGSHHDHDAPPAEPSVPPAHDDCHESHCHAVLAGAVAAPDCASLYCGGFAGWLPSAVTADEMLLGICRTNATGLAPDELLALPLRAHLRFAVLLI